MKEIIIDTIVLDYLTRNQKAITHKALQSIREADTVYVCVSSIWELANHVREGVIPLNSDFDSFYKKALSQLGLVLLDTQWKALDYLSKFDYQLITKEWTRIVDEQTIRGVKKDLHKDPFDRIIIAHAIVLRLPVVSPDTYFPFYVDLGLTVIW